MENFLSRLHFNKKILLELLLLFSLISLIVLIIIKSYPSLPSLISANFFRFRSSDKTKHQASPSPSPTPCPTKILPEGKQVYKYSHGKNVVGPKLQMVTIDPFDPQLNQTINVTAEIKHDSPVTKATAILVTDHKTVPQEMKHISGEPTNGTWTTEIKLEDTYLCTYQVNFDLQSETGNYQGGMTFRP